MNELAQWLRDAPFLRGRTNGGRPRRDSRDVVGLVLSGGGARSSFQVGALRYLYDEVGITPSVMTGTSAGSILASVLAQRGDHEGQRAALAELERIWLGMTDSSDMFTPYPWFARLRAHMPTWRKVLTLRARNGRHGDEEHAPGWSPSTVWEALGTLVQAVGTSTDLQTIVRGPTEERAAFTPGPIVDRLLEPHVFDPARLASSPVTLRIAVVGLESGDLRYVTNTGAFRDREDRPLPGPEVDVVEAIRASCAIPGVFPPVPLGSELYVDGGVRENLPVQVAIDHLGVTRCYAVIASPSGVPPRDSFADADMFDIIMRSASGIMSDELLRDEVAFAHRHGVTVIAPTVDVHDLATIDPGLISIAVDYGWLRAHDVVTGASPQRRALTDEIIRTRRRAWEAEEAVYAPTPLEPATTGIGAAVQPAADRDRVAALKSELRDLLGQLPAGELPGHAQSWWRGWERHAFTIDDAPPL